MARTALGLRARGLRQRKALDRWSSTTEPGLPARLAAVIHTRLHGLPCTVGFPWPGRVVRKHRRRGLDTAVETVSFMQVQGLLPTRQWKLCPQILHTTHTGAETARVGHADTGQSGLYWLAGGRVRACRQTTSSS